MTSENGPGHSGAIKPSSSLDQLSHISATVNGVIDAVSQRISMDDLVKRSRPYYRVVDRRELVRRIVDSMVLLVDAFEIQALKSIERERDEARRNTSSNIDGREAVLRDEGANRVLRSVVDFVDVVETVIDSLSDTQSRTMAKALDKRLDGLLRTHGFERIATVGARFDSSLHECIDTTSEGECETGFVVHEISRGYARDGRALRFAKVVIKKER